MSKKSALTWRVNDIVIASVLAVACAVIFWAWNNGGYNLAQTALALAPEYASLVGGTWLIAGVLGGYIIRKPGAALYTELLAAIISMLLGSSYSVGIILSGLIQGLGTELIFLLFAYRIWNLGTALLAGASAGAFMGISELFIYFAGVFEGSKAVTYAVCGIISGTVLAGLVSWLLTHALASTGALDSLAAGRARRRASNPSRTQI
ncbi:MAG: ECF transporter S component [Rothia sp. (in: high G+C Gram-positive bacteria)]|nr:ECF transporter S component [Rothia sp. (in: high G+C Gram-positive bacteria)]